MYTFDENIDRIEQAKSDIKAAIEEKGVYVGDGNINTYAGKVRMIKSAGKQQNKNITITENNTTTSIVADEGYILDKVNVSTDIPIQEKKELVVNDNGTYTISVDEEYEGLKTAEIEVNIPLEKGVVRTFTNVGEYDIVPTDGYKGIESAKVKFEYVPDGKQKIKAGFSMKGSTFETFDMTQWDWSEVKELNYLFATCRSLKQVTLAYCKPYSVGGMFGNLDNYNGNSLTEIDLTPIDFSDCYTYGNMFASSYYLERIIGLDKLNTGKSCKLTAVFKDCKALTNLDDVKNWDVSNVCDLYGIFMGCESITEFDLSKWRFNQLRECSSVFSNCKSLVKVDVSNWDFSKVKRIDYWFSDCSSLKEIRINTDVSHITFGKYMFSNVTTEGVFYYNPAYDYSNFIALLPTTWTAVPLENN